ncbi:hypothetical protein DEI92_04740 [Curtobacterium sp. MCBD17_034]|nr:hypothetical protein DEI92_04740 [Curtobacterium sp. MCBD17_034]PZM40290.1 hypothetical protein DEI90_00975 [Curtobacterium sp. MCBD17_031]
MPNDVHPIAGDGRTAAATEYPAASIPTMDDETTPRTDADEDESRISGWLQRHADLVWYALGVVFVVDGISALVNLVRGVPGPDDSNVISTFGGFIAGIAALVVGLRTARDHREHPDDE